MVEVKVDATEAGAVMGDEVVMQLKGNFIGKKLPLVLLVAQKPNPPTPAQFPLTPLTPLIKGGTGFQVSLNNRETGFQVSLNKGETGFKVPLNNGETGFKVPLNKGDLGGSHKICEHGSLFQGRAQGVGRKVLGLALFIGVLLVSESVAATPQQFSARLDPPQPPLKRGENLIKVPLFKGDLGGSLGVGGEVIPEAGRESLSLAQQPTTNQQDATRAAAKQALEEAVEILQQGTAESLRQAIPKFEQAVTLSRQAGDKASEALSFVGLGRVYNSLGEQPKALEFFNQALPLFRAVGDRGREATTLTNIGAVYSALGEKQKALEYYNQALPLYQAVGNRGGEASTLNNIGAVYDSWGEKQKALEFLNQALPLLQAVGDRAREANTLNNIGKVYSDLGENQKALEYYNQALPLLRAVGDRVREASILTNIGSVYSDLGEKQKALEYYNQALPIRRAVGDRGGEANTLNNIAGVYDSWGEKQKALEFLNQALPVIRAVGDRGGEAYVLTGIGKVYSDLGENQKALEYYNQALPIRRAVGDRNGEAATLNNIASVYDSLGEKQKALDFYNQALPLLQAVGNKRGEASILTNIGNIYNDLGEKQKALDFYNQALPIRRAVGDRSGEANTLNGIGRVYYGLEQKQKALELFNQALPLKRAAGNRDGEAGILSNLAYLQRSQGNLKEALTLMENSITIIEDLRTKIGSQELRASYFATVQDYYQFYIDLLMQLHQQNPNQGYDVLALNASERSRARSLIELLTEAQANIRLGADPKLLELESTLLAKLDTLEKRRLELVSGKFTDAQVQALEQERKALQQEYQQLQEQIRRTSPRYASLKYPQPLTLSEIQQQVLDDDTLLLEYSLGSDRSYLWAVTKTRINSYELPKRADIEALAQSFYQNTGKQKAPERGLGAVPREDSLEVTTQLSQMLLSPVAGQLAGKRLLIVSDGALQYLPFAALPTPDSLGKGENNQANLSPNPSPPLPNPLLQGEGRGINLLLRGESDSPLPLQGRGARGVRSSLDKNPVPLIVQHEIVNLPSASTLAIIRQDTKGRKLAPKMIAVIADPVFSRDDERLKSPGGQALVGQAGRLSEGRGGQDAHPTSQDSELSALALTRSAREAGVTFQRLPFTRQESSRILSLVPSTQSQSAFDFAANRAIATSPELRQFQIVHFATHGILNSQNPELSGVILSLLDEKGTPQNGFLRLNDIFNLNLPAELIVLSACETGLGQNVKGEGLVGLTRGFMYAGAPRVLVSLWSVSDEGTSELMTRFYKKMLEDKLPPAAALRAAQIEMLQNPQWKNPYYWAAFTLQGEWR